jgi:hypothetical protein
MVVKESYGVQSVSLPRSSFTGSFTLSTEFNRNLTIKTLKTKKVFSFLSGN